MRREDAHSDRRIRRAALAIVNGKVWAHPNATAVLIDGERIVAVGAERFSAAQVIDARGLAIIPAFNDAHVHFLTASRSLGQLDLFGAATQAEVERRIDEYARGREGEWIVGRGWLYSAFPGGMPEVALLDRLVPHRPAYLESFDAHTGWANSRALEIAGAASQSVLKEAAMETVRRHLPRPSLDEDLDALRAGMRLAASRGIGSVQEAGGGQEQLGLWRSLRDRGELTLRVRLAFDLTPETDIAEYGEPARGDEWISTGILKAFADGVVESKTAAMLAPYEGSDEKGESLWSPDQLRAAVRAANARGWQVQIHAIGDAAIRMALDAYEGATPGRRHRVEHIETPDPSDLRRFARLGVVASMQPQHSDPAITGAWGDILGRERAARGWPWRALLDSGAHLAFGTDWPVVPLDPFASLRMATRDLTFEDAMDAWTSGSAYAEHMDREKGKVREGMLADLAVVDLERSVVRATVVAGRVVYES
jgi:predicted amidohydrolase YtcJ